MGSEEKHFDVDTIEPYSPEDVQSKQKELPPIRLEPMQINTSRSVDSLLSSGDKLSDYGQSYNQCWCYLNYIIFIIDI